MVSEDKLIKQGIKLTDAWFEKFKKQIEHDLSLCETYEEFIERTKEYTTANILINSGYAAEMQSLITQILNNHKFQRASQRALIEETINNNVGHLIQDVGEEIKETVRDVVKEGYDEGSHPREIAWNINHRIDGINRRRARTIARTEVKRTDTVANYVRHKEQGATGFNVQCRPDCCPICAKDYAHKDPKKQQARLNRIAQMKRDKVDDPLVRGKGETIGGNVEFSMEDTLMLPPRHPNCRCTAMFVYGGTVETQEPKQTTITEPTDEQLKQNLTPEEYIRYTRTVDRDIENYYKSYTETFKDDEGLVKLFKTKHDDAVKEKKLLAKKALTGGDKKEPFSISPLEDYSIETLRRDLPINDKTFDKLINWSKKRASKNKIEYGYQFDTSTGEIIGDEVRGKKGSVTFTQQGTNIGSMHTHPPIEGDVGGGSFPSKQDLKIYRSQRGADHLIGSPTEIWYVHAEENLNSGVLGQREIDTIYNKVYNEVSEKGQELVKQGKLKTDNDSLRKFLDKEIGDGLLREFNTKEWQDKGFYIRRVYR